MQSRTSRSDKRLKATMALFYVLLGSNFCLGELPPLPPPLCTQHTVGIEILPFPQLLSLLFEFAGASCVCVGVCACACACARQTVCKPNLENETSGLYPDYPLLQFSIANRAMDFFKGFFSVSEIFCDSLLIPLVGPDIPDWETLCQRIGR